MGQKVCPTSLRIGITEDWRSRWYADKKLFGTYVVEDEKIRRLIKRTYSYAGIPRIDIVRTREDLSILVHCARPGLLIGRKGVEVERLKGELEGLTGRSLDVNVQEVEHPELNAQLVAEEVAGQLQRRASFRQVIARAAEATMDAGAVGVRIGVAGRLTGAELARREKVLMGSIPLQTLTARIDYGFAEARTKYGLIGVKAWVNHGRLPPGTKMNFGEETPNAPDA
jgi:small subunit ribosomal protein S3